MTFDLIAPCYFGTESSAAFDFKRIGAQDVKITDGRISFKGDENIIAAANLHTRCTERILIVLKTFKALSFDELFDAVSEIAWEELMPQDAEFPVKGSSLSSLLSSVPACQSIVKKAVVERMKKGHKVNTLPESGAKYKIRFSIRKDIAQIMLDTSGAGLHKRGYRRNSTLAPIKETLAATIVDLGRIYSDSIIQDPFCGSGTLIIEAAMKAMNMAPGLRRHFAGENYSFLPKKTWENARRDALEQVKKDAEFEGFGFDIDPDAIELAKMNAKFAGVESKCKFIEADVKNFSPAQRSIIFTNPPYGQRLGDLGQAKELAKVLGQRLEESPIKSAYIITADADFEHNFGKKANRRRKLYNGMIPCQVYMYF